MNKLSIKLIAVLLLGGLGFSFLMNPNAKKTYQVDTEKSVITWKGEKVTGSHTGNISIKEGEFLFEDDLLTGGSFVIDMTSMTNTDLKDEGTKNKLMGHLKSDDFFGVEKYPTANFEATKVISRGKPGDYKIVGNMTIKDHTEEIRFNASINSEGDQIKGVADITLDRTLYDVRYGSGSFFDNLGDKTIYDEFYLQIELVGNAAETMMSKE